MTEFEIFLYSEGTTQCQVQYGLSWHKDIILTIYYFPKCFILDALFCFSYETLFVFFNIDLILFPYYHLMISISFNINFGQC